MGILSYERLEVISETDRDITVDGQTFHISGASLF